MKYRIKPCVAIDVRPENVGKLGWIIEKKRFLFWSKYNDMIYFKKERANEALDHLLGYDEHSKSR